MNKKIIFLTIIVSFFAFLVFTNIVFGENVTVSCTDSDGGNNFTVKGITVGFQNQYVPKNSSNLQTVQDFCINDHLVQEYSCMSADPTSQFYGVYSATSSECISCSDGACLGIKEITSCEGSTNSSIEAYYYGSQIKVSYNDGTQQIFTDGCGISSGSGETGIQHYYCGYSGSKPHFWSVLKTCSNGCSNGACILPVNTTCTDSDGGKNYYINGCMNNGVCDQCGLRNSDGTLTNKDYCKDEPNCVLFEVSCSASGQYGSYASEDYKCPYGCKYGACINSTTTCTDSDGGINYFTKGCTSICTFTQQGGGCGLACDICSDNALTEGYCEGKEGKTIKYICPVDYVCKDGACVKSEGGCVNHDECSQACDDLGINSKWMGSGYNYKSWDGTCPSNVYGCMTGKCCLGQCNQEGNCFCYRTNKVDIYGSVCPEGTTCGNDCYCHPKEEEFNFYVKTDKYSYSPGENVRITAVLYGASSSYNFNDVKIVTFVTDSQGKQYEVKMEPVGTSASTCTATATGTTCSIRTEYNFVGNHIIPSNGPIGTWKILSTGVAGGNRKNAEINFEVQKVAYDYVDVSINPKEQSTIIGKEVKYDVTITDKHPVMKCYVATQVPVTSATSGGVSIATGGILASETAVSAITPVETKTEIVKCGPQIYNYLIDVGGLPYHIVFPTVVNVHAGGSNTFELKVFLSSVKTAEGITTTVETTTTTAATSIAERTVTITGQPIATQPSATSTQQETTPVKEATFKFAVKVYLKEDQATSDSAIGILHVKFIETPEPPPFPDTEKVNIELNKGWNLVSVPGKGIGFIKGTCSEDKKPVAFVYVLDKQRYVSFEEALNIMGKEKLLDYLSTHSFWVYSYDSCNIGFKFNGYSTYSGLAINRGWNLLGVTKDMMGDTLSNIKGNCTFEKIYKWDSSSQKWIEKSENDLISEKGNGIVVQTVTDCNLKANFIQPPPFPGE